MLTFIFTVKYYLSEFSHKIMRTLILDDKALWLLLRNTYLWKMFVKLLCCWNQIYFWFLFQKALKKAKVQLAEKLIACDKDEADKFNGGKNVTTTPSCVKNNTLWFIHSLRGKEGLEDNSNGAISKINVRAEYFDLFRAHFIQTHNEQLNSYLYVSVDLRIA